MIQQQSAKIHWNFFIAIEQDTERLTRFVEPVEANFATYSLETCRILFAAASECEVVLRELAKRWQPNPGNILELQSIIAKNVPDFAAEKVWIPRYGLELQPWSNWIAGQVPEWWTAYNKVKHERISHYERGNLKNALNATAALLVVVVTYYRHELSATTALDAFSTIISRLEPDSVLFRLHEDRYYLIG